MNESKEALKIYRTAIGIEQKRLRENATKTIDRSLKNPDFGKLVRSRKNARKEADDFVEWLDEMMKNTVGYQPPKESQRLARWLIKNKEIAFGGYNPYLLSLARHTANDVEETGFMGKVKTLANKLADISKYWLEKWQKI